MLLACWQMRLDTMVRRNLTELSLVHREPSVIHMHVGNLLLLTSLVFFCHGLVLFNDGIYWDDWVLHGLYLNNDVDSLLNLFREAGNPIVGYFHLAFWLSPDPKFVYNLVSFLSILLSTHLVYLLALRVRYLSSRESLFIGAMYCCFTAYQVYVTQITLPARFCYFLFLLAAYISLHTTQIGEKNNFLHRVCALAIFAISFTHNSLLVFYFPFLILLFSEHRDEWIGRNLQGKFAFALRFADFILLPFVYWLLKKIIWKPYGGFEGYNQLLLEPIRWRDSLAGFADNVFFMQLYHAIKLDKAYPILVVSLATAIVVAEWFINRKRSQPDGVQSSIKIPVNLKRIGWAILLGTFLVFIFLFYVIIPSSLLSAASSVRGWSVFHVFFVSLMIVNVPILFWQIHAFVETRYLALYALLLLFCAVFPYAIVGRIPFYSGTGTRHALLISLPVAVMLVVFGRAFASIVASRLSALVLPWLAGFLVATFVLSSTMIYIEWQVRWIKDLSIIENLRKLPREQIERVNAIFIDDQFPVLDLGYNYYEYTGMFKAAWHEESRLGSSRFNEITPEDFIRKFPLRMNLLKDFKLGGCRATVQIRQADPGMSHPHLVASYYLKRFFQTEALPAFLGEVSIVEMSDISCP